MRIEHEKIRKILVIKFGGIGDVILSTPLLKNLRNYYLDKEINYLTQLKCRDVLMDNPDINRILTFDLEKDDSLRLLKTVKKKKYDLIIDLFCNPRTTFLTFYSNAKYRVGFNFPRRGYAYNLIVDGKYKVGDFHHADFGMLSLKKLGIPFRQEETYISILTGHKDFANEFFNSHNLNGIDVIGIPISGGWESKKYKAKDFVELINVINQCNNFKYILLWGTETEKKECEYINKNLPELTFIAPETSIRYAAALMRKCKAVISNDSGLMHVAAATGVPVLGIFGPTSPLLQGPYGKKHLTVVNDKLACLNCALLKCPIENICMTELDKNTIVNKLKILIQKNK
ncbi:MAG: glycosyltransferase family 9 protein [Ignavibacteria bacterium]|nr:glycosyltransferase family 9 protein [Ignavibacteria bacterium]